MSRRSRLAIQRVGDRDKVCWSIKEYAFTINANPMSDRKQLILEIYEDDRMCIEGKRRRVGQEGLLASDT
jgi:hypothetical protein